MRKVGFRAHLLGFLAQDPYLKQENQWRRDGHWLAKRLIKKATENITTLLAIGMGAGNRENLKSYLSS